MVYCRALVLHTSKTKRANATHLGRRNSIVLSEPVWTRGGRLSQSASEQNQQLMQAILTVEMILHSTVSRIAGARLTTRVWQHHLEHFPPDLASTDESPIIAASVFPEPLHASTALLRRLHSQELPKLLPGTEPLLSLGASSFAGEGFTLPQGPSERGRAFSGAAWRILSSMLRSPARYLQLLNP